MEKKMVPDNRSYADTTGFWEKMLIVGDSHLKKIKRNRSSNSFRKEKIQDLEHKTISS